MKIASRISGQVPESVPRSMLVKNPKLLIHKLLLKYDDVEEPWNEKIYRSGGDGSYFHVSQEGAEFYEQNVKEYDFPNFSKAILIDLENPVHLKFIDDLGGVLDPNLTGDISTLINDILPKLVELGFDGVIISGETGSDVEGPPIEIVKL